MQRFSLLHLVVSAATAMAQQPGEDGRYTISAPGIKAQVRERVRDGATITFWSDLCLVHPVRGNTDELVRQRQEW